MAAWQMAHFQPTLLQDSECPFPAARSEEQSSYNDLAEIYKIFILLAFGLLRFSTFSLAISPIFRCEIKSKKNKTKPILRSEKCTNLARSHVYLFPTLIIRGWCLFFLKK